MSLQRARTIMATAFTCAGLCLVAPSVRAAAVSVHLQPTTLTVAPGDTFTVEVAAQAADSVFNAFDVYLVFDPDRVELVPTVPVSAQIGPLMTSACGNLFHVFTPHVSQCDITCSLLCNQVFVNGPGVIYRVRFRAMPSTGPTTLTLASATRFYKAGFILLPVASQGMTVTVSNVTGVGRQDRSGPDLEPPFPNPGNGAGPLTLAFTLPEAGSARFDVYDSAGRRVHELASRPYSSGRHSVVLPVRDLAPGHYWVRLSDTAGRQATRGWTVLR
jgi:hypothetical protein